MATTNRAQLLTRLQKAVRKAYKQVPVQTDRPVMEHLLFACLLEDAQQQPAEDALAAVADAFFDWNEVRVTTIGELAEMMPMLPDPEAAARRLRETLQSVFESVYSFDLEAYRKLNLGHASNKLEQLKGTTGFTVGYVVQMALGGHTIPLGRGTLSALQVVGIIDEKEAAKGVVPGLERLVPKAKGAEFASILHQLGADFFANPYDTSVHAILLEISPECKPNLPKKLTKRQRDAILRKQQKEEEEAAAKLAAEKAAAAKKVADEKAAVKAAERAAAKKVADVKKAAAKKVADEKRAAAKKISDAKKAVAKKAADAKKAAAKKAAAKKAGAKKSATTKRSAAAAKTVGKKKSSAKKGKAAATKKTKKKPAATTKAKKNSATKSRRSAARGTPRKPR